MALGRKNYLFVGSDRGGEHWAIIASLVGTCRLNDVNPHTHLTNAFERIVAGHPQGRIDDPPPGHTPRNSTCHRHIAYG
jgi:transposase